MKFLQRILILFFLFGITNLHAQCHYKLSMYDSWGDGWNGAYLEVTMNGTFVGNYECYGSYTLDSVYSLSGTTMDFIFHSGTWDSEITFAIIDPLDDTLFYGPAPSDLDNLLHQSTSSCSNSAICLSPASAQATPNGLSGVDLSWSTNLNDSLWNVEWGAFGLAQGTGTLINNITSPLYNVNSLSNGTYEFYVQSLCNTGNLSSWSGPYMFTVGQSSGLCGSYVVELFDSWGDGWNGGTLDAEVNGTILNSFTMQTGFGPDVFTFPVDSGDVINLIYTPGMWPEEKSYIVYDHQGNVLVSQNSVQHNGPNSTYGLISCQSCPAPLNLLASVTSATSADLTWQTNSSNQFNLEWGLSGFVQGTGNLVTTLSQSSYTLTSLTSNQTYDFYVQSVCDSNDLSNWSGPFSFTPAPTPCLAPFWVSPTVITDSTAEIFWVPTSTDSLWNLEWGLTGFIPGTGNMVNNITTTNFIIPNLSPLTTYDVYVQTVCDTTNVSSWSNAVSFTTIGAPASPGTCGYFTLMLYDSWGDGWNGGYMTVNLNNVFYQDFTMTHGHGPETFLVAVDSADQVDFIYNAGSWPSENSYEIYDENMNMIASQSGANGAGPPGTLGLIACDGGGFQNLNCGTYTLKLFDGFGNGWNNSYLEVSVNNQLNHNATLISGFGPSITSFVVDSNDVIDLIYHPSANSQGFLQDGYQLIDPSGNVVAEEICQDTLGPASNHGLVACQSSISPPNMIDENPLDFKIYPNPANSQLYIKSSTEIVMATLSNFLGQVVLSLKNNNIEGIDLSDVPSGNYLLTLSDGDKFSTQKVNILK